MPDFQIRRATSGDVPDIYALIRGLAEYEHALVDVVATEASLTESLFGAKPQAEVLLGCEDGRAVGLALFFHNYSTWRGCHGVYLEDLFVVPEKRSRGYGKALLIAVAKIAHERRCGRFEWAVLDWNTPAIGFYKSLGAVALEEWTVFRLTEEAIARLAGE